ncbi:MAG: PHP domain-containing protein, partial [Treponema sp.]|nr:PHP domain-containing protein [Treponema sp.]
GWEETFDGDDYLVYGLDRAWLLEHPESKSWSRGEQYRIVNQYGGCVVQAHPFRQHFYIPVVRLSSGCVNAVEAANAGNHEQSYDALAMRYAEKLALPATAGSDIHTVDQLNNGNIFGIILNEKMKTIADYVAAIKKNNIAGLRITEGRCDYYGDERVSLPVDIRNKNDKSTGMSLDEFFE